MGNVVSGLNPKDLKVLKNEIEIGVPKPTNKNIKKSKKNEARILKNGAKFKNKEARKNRRADRLAAKKGFAGAGSSDNDERMSARKEARGLMDERRQKGRQFFIDLAKNAAGTGDSNDPYTPTDMRSGDQFLKDLKTAATDPTTTEKNQNVSSDNPQGKVNQFDKFVNSSIEMDTSLASEDADKLPLSSSFTKRI